MKRSNAAATKIVSAARYQLMTRVKLRTEPAVASMREHSSEPADTALVEEARPVAVSVQEPITLRALCSNRIVMLTMINTFMGIGALAPLSIAPLGANPGRATGVSGTFLASIGNFGLFLAAGDASLDEPTVTFQLTMAFLVAQAVGRLVNLIVFAENEIPWLFAIWHSATLLGVFVFVVLGSLLSGMAASVLVGLAFGGFQSGFPIVVQTAFPGGNGDFAQSIGFVYIAASFGTLGVGQLSSVVYGASSLGDLRRQDFFNVFMFFIALSVVSLGLSIWLGVLIKRLTAAGV